MPKSLIVIPARMDSSRFPGKPLAMAKGRPLVEWTYRRAEKTTADYVWVVTPDREIGRFCQSKGIPWRPSNENHPTGTHRCAEFLSQVTLGFAAPDIDVVVNWQCDEPLVEPIFVNELIGDVRRQPDKIHTLAVPVKNLNLRDEPNLVKVVLDRVKRCLWFSRHKISQVAHCGIYGYSPAILEKLGQLKVSTNSEYESLEQLSWIEEGFEIQTITMDELPLSINAPNDLKKFEAYLEDLETFKSEQGEENEN